MEAWSDEDAHAVLGVGVDSDEKALRDAYLSKIREHPPERDPEGFERVRDAYLVLTSPGGRMQRWFDDEVLKHPLRELADKTGGDGRAFLGAAAWRELLRNCKRNAGGKPYERR